MRGGAWRNFLLSKTSNCRWFKVFECDVNFLVGVALWVCGGVRERCRQCVFWPFFFSAPSAPSAPLAFSPFLLFSFSPFPLFCVSTFTPFCHVRPLVFPLSLFPLVHVLFPVFHFFPRRCWPLWPWTLDLLVFCLLFRILTGNGC